MIPISEVHYGDIFKRPNHHNEYHVVMVNKSEKMIKLQPMDPTNIEHIMDAFWVKNTHLLICECFRVFSLKKYSPDVYKVSKDDYEK